MKWIIVALSVLTVGLGGTTAYVLYQRHTDKWEIDALRRANTEMSDEITKLVDSYNANLDQSISSATGAVSADAKKELDKIVSSYNATSSELAGAKAKLSGSAYNEKTLNDLVNQLNAANSKIAELEASKTTVDPSSMQKLVDELNAANARIVELETKLAATGQ